jgi:hypothetical protein
MPERAAQSMALLSNANVYCVSKIVVNLSNVNFACLAKLTGTAPAMCAQDHPCLQKVRGCMTADSDVARACQGACYAN